MLIKMADDTELRVLSNTLGERKRPLRVLLAFGKHDPAKTKQIKTTTIKTCTKFLEMQKQ